MDMISDAVQDGKEFFTANSTSNATTVNIQNDAADTANEIKITDELSTEKKIIPESKILETLINKEERDKGDKKVTENLPCAQKKMKTDENEVKKGLLY